MNAICIERGRHFARSGLLIAVLLALLAAAGDAAAATSGCEARAARAHQVLLAGSMDNWEPLDDRAVLIWTRHSVRAYLVRLDTVLAGLTDAPMIYLVDADRDGNISPCGRDGIVIGDGVDITQVARIASIELLSAKRTAELDPGGDGMRREALRI